MEYELDIEGYVLNVYFGCNNDDTTPYAGDMPEGYSTLEDWAENEEIKAWKIVDGNLVKDNAKEAELMDQFENEHNDNKNVSHKELVPLEDAINILNASQPYKTANKTGKFISLNDAKASQPDFRLTNIDPYAFDKINLMVTGKNILPNTATSKEIDGLTITQNSDRSITLDGTAIPEGETVEGTDLTINDAEQNKKAKIKRIKGITNQEAGIGKNKFRTIEQLGIDSTYTNGTLTLASATYNKSNKISVNGSNTYTLSVTNSSTNTRVYIREFDENDNPINIITTYLTTSSTFTPDANTAYIIVDFAPSSSDNFPITISNIQLEEGTTATAYEPYRTMPSPEFPSEIKNVSGDNDVTITNKNLFSGDYSQFDNEGGQGTTYAYFKLPTDNEVYTLTMTAKNDFPTSTVSLGFTRSGGTYTGGFVWCIPLSVGTILKGTKLSIQNKRNGIILPFVSMYYANAQTLQLFMSNFDIQLEKGSATDYVPYQQQTFRFDLGGKNLLNPSNVTTSNGITSTLNNDGSISSNGTPNNRDYNLTNYMDFNLPAGTYTFSIDHAREYEIVLCLRNANNEEEIHSIGSGDKSVVFTTSETNTGWYVWSRASSGTSINETIKIQLEKGSTPSRYSPYVANPIELCKIGNYQDYIYKSNGNWYVHKEIGKIVLDENTSLQLRNTSANNTYTYSFNSPFLYKIESSSVGETYSDYFKPIRSVTGVSSMYGNELVDVLGIALYYNANMPNTRAIYINSNVQLTSSWLGEHKPVVYYVLATPTDTQITDTNLINQLEALQDIQLYEDVAYVTTNSNPKAPMVLEYNLPYNIEYDLAGTINNVVPFLVFKKALDYFLSGLSNFNIKMYNYDGTDRTQIFSGSNGLINMSSDLVATHIVLEIPTETTYDELTLYPQLERGTEATAYETPKIKSAVIDFSNYIDRDTLTTSIDYILTDGAYVTASIDNELVDLDNIYIALFDGYNNVFAIQDVNIEMSYFINALDDGNVFATKLELNAAEGRFELSISEVQDEVDDKLDSADYTRASIVGKINDGTSQVQIEADNVSLAGKTIDLTSDNITIDSDNFSVDDEGNMECANANITGGEINLTGGNTVPKITVTNPNNPDIQMKLSSAMLVGSNSDGVELLKLFGNIGAIALYDTTSDNTIIMNGLTGEIACKKLTQTSIETDSATMNNTYVDAVENNHYEKAGNVVSYSFTITTKGTWNATTVFASNLPAPKANTRFVATNVNRNIPFRAEIRTDGTIRNAYSNTTPATGDVLEGHITYITDDN